MREVYDRIEMIKADRAHGASWLSRQALETLKLATEKSDAATSDDFIKYLMQVGRDLMKARPSMASLTNITSRAIYYVLENSKKVSDLDSLEQFTIQVAEEMIESSLEAMHKAAFNSSQLIQEKSTIITHSYSSTVKEAIKLLKRKDVKVIVTESRPLYEGRKLATELLSFEIPFTLIIDSAIGYFTSEADVALVGADSILSDGSIVNKTGTYLLALAAKESNIPFYVVCEIYKFDIKNYLGVNVELEEKEGTEIVEALSGINTRNIYFDITPPKLVTKIITDKRSFKPTEIRSYMKKLKRFLEWFIHYR